MMKRDFMIRIFQKNKKYTIARANTVSRPLSTVHRLLCVFAFTLPLSLNMATVLMWGILVVALYHGVFHRKNGGFKPTAFAMKDLSLLLPAVFFLLHVLALIYTSNTQASISELFSKSALLLFPLILWLIPLKREALQGVLWYFVLGVMLTGLVCFVRSLINYNSIGAVSWLSYTWLSSQMGFLPAYLSLYMSLAFFISINWLMEEWGSSRIWVKMACGFALLFAGYMIVMLGARLVSVTFLSLLVGGFLTWMYHREMLLRGLFAVALFALGLWKLLDSFFVTRTRMNKIVGKQLIDYDHNLFININDPRGQIWESCLAAMERIPVWGYGIGDEVECVLLEIYDLKNYYHLLTVNTDAHNQYVQTFLSLGYPGLLCLLMMIALPLYLTWKNKAYLYTLFLLLIAIPMLTECMLETAHGLMFYALFNSVLYSSLTRNSQLDIH